MRTPFHDRTRVLEFIVEYKRAHNGNSPTKRQIGEALGIASTNTVQYILDELVRRGLIRLAPPGTSRNIEVPGYEFSPQTESP